jgi:hypothetical protein
VIGIDGNAQLLAYIGHDGLMDFKLPDKFKNADGKTRIVSFWPASVKNIFIILSARQKLHRWFGQPV